MCDRAHLAPASGAPPLMLHERPHIHRTHCALREARACCMACMHPRRNYRYATHGTHWQICHMGSALLQLYKLAQSIRGTIPGCKGVTRLGSHSRDHASVSINAFRISPAIPPCRPSCSLKMDSITCSSVAVVSKPV